MFGEKLDEKAIFNAARTIESAEARAEYLRQACGNDLNLLERVRTLLNGYEEQASFLESPAVALSGGPTIIQPISERPGTVIGSYKLLQQIGEGGMGVVFMAEQTEPIQRTVALKIIKPGMDTRQVIARFEAERQALALMDHPNIAKVLDAGTTDSGRPYFVMELVKGVPITKYCDDKQLSIRERLELFKPVCEAVQHAHQKGIIHRDLKPANVLVAEYDNRAVPKVIDFGVAKATAQKLTERTMFTEFGQVIGTVEYMSPEQAKFNQLDIDTRSDIYSLGVLLYELLTGSTPFDRERLRTAAFDEVLRIIREEEPPSPSTRLSSSDTLPSIAANRNTEPAKLSGQLRGELDWIVLKALDKERSRRYETANGFVQDVDRFLNDEVISAGPESALYRFRKAVRRNRRLFAVGLLIATTILVGAGLSIWQAIRATRSEIEQVRLREIADKQRTLATAAAERERNAAEKERLARESADRAKALAMLRLADNYTSRGLEAGASRLNGRSSLWFAKAAIAAHDDPELVRSNLTRANNWQRDQWTPVAAFEQPLYSSDQLSFFSENSRYLLTYRRLGKNESPPVIWDLATEQALKGMDKFGPLGDIAWAPDGQVLVGGVKGNVVLASMPNLTISKQWDAGGSVYRVAASPNGRFVAAATGKKLLVWNVSNLAQPAFVEHAEGIVHIAFSPTSERVVTATDNDNSAHLFGIESDEASSPRLRPVLQSVTNVYRAANENWITRHPVFVDKGRQLVTVETGAIKWYDTTTGAELATTSLPRVNTRSGVAVSEDGNTLIIAGAEVPERTVAFDTRSRQRVSTVGNALHLALSPNGKFLAFSGIDLEIRGVQQGRIKPRVFPTLSKGGSPAFSYDGSYMAVITSGLTQVWKMPDVASFRKFPLEGRRSWVGFSPNGKYVAPIGATNGLTSVRTIGVRATATGAPVGTKLPLETDLIAADFSPDSTLLAAITGVHGDQPQLRIWNWMTGTLVCEPVSFDSEPVWTCFAPDGKAVAVHFMNGQVVIVDPANGKLLLRFTCQVPRQNTGAYPWMSGRGTIRFSRDSKTLYTWGSRIVQAWDRATGLERWAVSHPMDCWSFAESPDGRIIATGTYDGYLRFWNSANGGQVRAPIEHPNQILTVSFSPDGRLVGTACSDSQTRVWDVANGTLVCSMTSSDYLTDVRFTSDGRFAINADAKGLQVWNIKEGAPASQICATWTGALPSLDVSPDGRWAVIGGDSDQFAVVDLQLLTEAAQGTPEDLLPWAELISNVRDNGSTIVELTGSEWLERWREWRRAHPEFRPFEETPKPPSSSRIEEPPTTDKSDEKEPAADH